MLELPLRPWSAGESTMGKPRARKGLCMEGQQLRCSCFIKLRNGPLSCRSWLETRLCGQTKRRRLRAHSGAREDPTEAPMTDAQESQLKLSRTAKLDCLVAWKTTAVEL